MKTGLLFFLVAALFFIVPADICAQKAGAQQRGAAQLFVDPPESAKPGVLWMWMGCNISKSAITKDLEALKAAGFNRTTMFSLADVTSPWSDVIEKSPTPELIAWTEPWWQLVRFAAEESKRLNMEFGMFNCPGYTASGGPWITPERSMKQLIFSQVTVGGGSRLQMSLKKPVIDNRANTYFPVYNPKNGLVEKPVIPARDTFFRDIAVLAMPSRGVVPKDSIIDLSNKLDGKGQLEWNAPAGEWTIYRFGYTIMGSLIQPAQPQALGLECDKIDQEAINYHMDHVLGEIKRHLGDLIGTGFTHVHFDSYEAGTPSWTNNMREEFSNRRAYDPVPYLGTFAGRVVGSRKDSARFMDDFDATIKDLYRDIYFTTVGKKLGKANLKFLCEPYGGPWRQDDIMPLVPNVMTEFWTNKGQFSPYELEPTVKALRKSGQNIVEAEAFTGDAGDSKWDETPAWLKPIGDAAFCAGVNRFILHRFAQQPFSESYLPGMTMGRWGTHFDRTQTWWEPGKALVRYWQRCQALLQWGSFVPSSANDFHCTAADTLAIKEIHRRKDSTDIYFIANTSRNAISANCVFNITGRQPELWDPVTATMRDLPDFEDKDGKTSITVDFDKAQSFFIVFRDKYVHQKSPSTNNFPKDKVLYSLNGNWNVKFDQRWGGPVKNIVFDSLTDWTLNTNNGIKYYSGTAVYTKRFNLPSSITNTSQQSWLDLGTVNHIALVELNGKSLGVVWTAPWRISIPVKLLKASDNVLKIRVTNVWANRLIGDEQEPPDCEWLPGYIDNGRFLKEFPDWFLKNKPRPSKGRYCFTTWNYFTDKSPLISSGLLGPVRLVTLSGAVKKQ